MQLFDVGQTGDLKLWSCLDLVSAYCLSFPILWTEDWSHTGPYQFLLPLPTSIHFLLAPQTPVT